MGKVLFTGELIKIQMSRTRTTRWNLFFHYISIALMMVSGVLLVPLYLQHIPLKLYGAWLATGNVLLWLTAIDPGLSAILQQRVASAYGKADTHAVGSFISSGLIVSAAISCFLVLVGYVLSEYIPSLLNLSSDVDHKILVQAFWIAIIGSSLQLFSYAVTSINQGLQSSLGIGLVYVIVHLLDILLILVLIYCGYGLMSLAFSALFRGVGMVAGNMWYLMRRIAKEKISIQCSQDKLRELLSLMPFTFFAQISGSVGNNIDAFVTARFLGTDLVPVLVLTRKAFDICRMIISRPALAITPALSHLVGEGGNDKARQVLIRLVFMMTWLLALVVGGLLILNGEFVQFWVGSELYAGSSINALLCLGLVLAIVTTSLSNLCVALGDIKGSSLATLVQGALFIVLVFVGAKYGGLGGVVSAPLVAVLITGIWYFPRSFARLLMLTRTDVLLMGGELLRSVFAATLTATAISFMAVSSLVVFVLQAILLSVLYGVILALLSHAFRAECSGVFRKLYRHAVC